jgi:hypothetical protein
MKCERGNLRLFLIVFCTRTNSRIGGLISTLMGFFLVFSFLNAIGFGLMCNYSNFWINISNNARFISVMEWNFFKI